MPNHNGRSAVLAPNHKAFNNVLPSEPVALPFGGDYGLISVVYNLGRVLSFHMYRDDVVGDLDEQSSAVMKADKAALKAFKAEWDGKESEEGYEEASIARVKDVSVNLRRLGEIDRQMSIRMIDHLLIEFQGPFDLPNPHDGAALADFFDGALLDWLIAPDTLQEVAQQINNPKARIASPPISMPG